MPDADDTRLAQLFEQEEREQYAPEEAEEVEFWRTLREMWISWYTRHMAGYRQRVSCRSCGTEWIVPEARPFDGRTDEGTPAEQVKRAHHHKDTTARPQYKTETVQIGALEKGQLATVPDTGDHPGT